MEEIIDWKDERQEAIRLMEALESRNNLCVSSKRWLLRRWPQLESLDNEEAEKFLPESQLRDVQGHEVLLLIQRSLEQLYTGKCEYEASKHVALLSTMSSSQLERAIPYALPSLNITALYSLLVIISERSYKKSKNRLWLERKLRAELMAMDRGKLLDLMPKVSLIIQNSESGRKCLSSVCLLGEPLEVVPQPFPVSEAIKAAFQQLDMMSSRSLRAMNDILSKNPSNKITGLAHKVGSDKPKLALAVKRKLQSILNHMKDDSIPPHLHRALHIISLSAREKHPDDRNLSNYVGPVPTELELVHRKLLLGLSLTKKLNFHQLESIYMTISGESKRNFLKQHPRFYLQTIQVILREVLYRCDSNNVPEHVLKALEMIQKEAEGDLGPEFQEKEQISHEEAEANPNPETSGESKRRRLNVQRSEVELEALLNISSYLREVLCEHYEKHFFSKIPSVHLSKHNVGQTQIISPLESVDHHATTLKLENKLADQHTGMKIELKYKNDATTFKLDNQLADWHMGMKIEPKYEECIGDSDIGLVNNAGINLVAREGDDDGSTKPSSSKLMENICSEDELSGREDNLAKTFETIADQGSALVYVIIGRAMEEALRREGGYLPENVRRYLRMGLSNSQKDPEENIDAFENFGGGCEEEKLMVSIAESLSFISNSAMERAKARIMKI